MFNIVAIYKDWSVNKKILQTYRSSKTGNPTIDPLNEVPEDQLEKEQCSTDLILRQLSVGDLSVNRIVGLILGSANFAKEKDRLSSLKIIGKRYAFLFEDVWFILLQYLYFEKFFFLNSLYLAKNKNGLEGDDFELDKRAGLLIINSLFTALVGLGGLTTIPYCFKMIKQGKTKTRIFYVLTLTQILLQATFPFMRAAMFFSPHRFTNLLAWIKNCASVGFQVWFLRIQPLVNTNLRDRGDPSNIFFFISQQKRFQKQLNQYLLISDKGYFRSFLAKMAKFRVIFTCKTN